MTASCQIGLVVKQGCCKVSSVILSAAKNLAPAQTGILHFVQDDTDSPARSHLALLSSDFATAVPGSQGCCMGSALCLPDLTGRAAC